MKILLEEFSKTGQIQPLIYLYTLETPFYRCINQNKQSSEILALPIYRALRFLSKRAFQGCSYRGLSMTDEDINPYQWAEKNDYRYVVTNTFCSTTKNRDLAIGFGEANVYDGHHQVLMVFDFPIGCFTAIQLDKISGQLPCISSNEGEEEIPILPRTIFSITKVERNRLFTTIYLRYFDLHREVDEYLTYRLEPFI